MKDLLSKKNHKNEERNRIKKLYLLIIFFYFNTKYI